MKKGDTSSMTSKDKRSVATGDTQSAVTADARSTATADTHSIAATSVRSAATAGARSTATADTRSIVAASARSVATTGDRSTTTADTRSIATTSARSKATAGTRSVVSGDTRSVATTLDARSIRSAITSEGKDETEISDEEDDETGKADLEMLLDVSKRVASLGEARKTKNSMRMEQLKEQIVCTCFTFKLVPNVLVFRKKVRLSVRTECNHYKCRIGTYAIWLQHI